MLVERGSRSWLPDDIMGRCNVCRELVSKTEWLAHSHPCPGFHVGYGLGDIVNPDNLPWRPGYRFYIRQDSGARTGHECRGNRHKTSRVYSVHFEIDEHGELKHVGGPKPTDHSLAILQEQYARERPGSNWYPGADNEE